MNRKKLLIATTPVLLAIFLLSTFVTPTYALSSRNQKPNPSTVVINFTFKNEWGTYQATAYHNALKPNPAPTVVFVHGFGAKKDYYMWIAKALADSGFVAVLFTVPGVRNGEGFLGGNGVVDFLNARKWSDGISDCISEIEDWDIVDPDRIGVMGHSMGGLGAIIAASEDPRIQCVVGLAPAIIEIEEMSGKFGILGTFGMLGKLGIAQELMDSYLPVPDPTTFAVPIQIQWGTLDGFVPGEGLWEWYEGLVLLSEYDKDFFEIEGGNHVQFLDDSLVMKIAMRLDNEPTISTEEFHKLSSEGNGEHLGFIAWFASHL